MLFKSNKFFDLKSKKTLVKLVIQKLILLKTFVIILWNIDNYQSIYVIFLIFFCILQVKAVMFWDLTTWKCVISLYTYLYQSGFPIVGGMGGTPAPLILRFFSKTSPIKFWGAPPPCLEHLWETRYMWNSGT